jgi:hypothetical protein
MHFLNRFFLRVFCILSGFDKRRQQVLDLRSDLIFVEKHLFLASLRQSFLQERVVWIIWKDFNCRELCSLDVNNLRVVVIRYVLLCVLVIRNKDDFLVLGILMAFLEVVRGRYFRVCL